MRERVAWVGDCGEFVSGLGRCAHGIWLFMQFFSCNTLHLLFFPTDKIHMPRNCNSVSGFTLLVICHLQKPQVAFTTALACIGWGLLVKIHTPFWSGCLHLHDLETLSERHANCTENQQMMMTLYQACLADDPRCMTCDNQ